MEIKNLVKGKKYRRVHTGTINGIKYTAEGFPVFLELTEKGGIFAQSLSKYELTSEQIRREITDV